MSIIYIYKMKITFFKFKVTTLDTEDVNHYFNYPELKEAIGIPRSTLYKILDGADTSKYLKKYKFEKCHLPRHGLIDYNITPESRLDISVLT